MRKNIMLTIFALCVILIFVGCKNGYESIKEQELGEHADKSGEMNESLIEDTSSRRKYRICRSFRRNF